MRLAAVTGLFLLFSRFLELSWVLVFTGLFILLLSFWGWKFPIIFIKTIRRDVT